MRTDDIIKNLQSMVTSYRQNIGVSLEDLQKDYAFVTEEPIRQKVLLCHQ